MITAGRRQIVWIDVMGIHPTYINGFLDTCHRSVLVTGETLGLMIASLREADMFDDETTAAAVQDLEQAPVRHGLRDVTDALGGWDTVQEQDVLLPQPDPTQEKIDSIAGFIAKYLRDQAEYVSALTNPATIAFELHSIATVTRTHATEIERLLAERAAR